MPFKNQKLLYIINPLLIIFTLVSLSSFYPAISQTITEEELDLDPEIINNSPVLQRWLKESPNVLKDIRNDPSFKTRIRLGYSYFPSTDNSGGLNIGIEDFFLSKNGFTLSADYKTSFNGDRTSLGGNIQYYILPLGNYFNIAPVVGYRYLKTDNYSTDGVNLGLKLMLAFSRTGAGDISLTQSFISLGTNEEVGITSLSLGYAVTKNLRISTDIEQENSRGAKDSRLGLVLEWMP